MCHGFVAFLWQIPPIGPVLPVFPTYNCFAVNNLRVEWHLHTVEVVGSNPTVPTNVSNRLEGPQCSAIAPDRSNWSVNAQFYLNSSETELL